MNIFVNVVDEFGDPQSYAIMHSAIERKRTHSPFDDGEGVGFHMHSV